MSTGARVAKGLLQAALPRAFLWRLPPGAGSALTFDDGPHPEWTPRILDLLAGAGVRATFFVIGCAAARNPALIGRILREGHAIGSHTWSHAELHTLSPEALRQDLQRCREILLQAAHLDTRLLRPPRGRLTLDAFLRVTGWGYRVVHWSKTYDDFRQDGAQPLLGRMAARGLGPGDIALLHDTNPHTLAALTQMLPRWRGAGVHFVALG